MFNLCRLVWYALVGWLRSRASLEAENLALRHQLNILRRRSPKKPDSRQYRPAGICGVISFGPRYSGRSDNHQAGDADPLAPRWVSTVLAVEIETSRWPAKDRTGGSAAHSRDECCESVLGGTADPRRTPQARHRCGADDGRQIHNSGGDDLHPKDGRRFFVTMLMVSQRWIFSSCRQSHFVCSIAY